MKTLLRSTKLYFIALLAPLVIGGCIEGSNNLPKHTENQLTHLFADYCEKTKQGITVRVKALTTEKECIGVFGKNGKYLLHGRKLRGKKLRGKRNKIYPIKITIDNQSNQPWHLSSNNIDIKKAPMKKVLKKLHYRTGIRALLIGISFLGVSSLAAGSAVVFLANGVVLFFSPILQFFSGFNPAALFSVTATLHLGAHGALLATPVTVPSAAVASTVQGVSSSLANHNLTKQVKESTLQSMIVEPSQIKSTLIFVQQRDYKSNFAITLQPENETDDTLLFDVQLPAV